MAERDKLETGTLPGGPGEEPQAQWLTALVYVRENPTKVGAGIGFLLLCVAIGGMISLKQMADDRKVTTEYAAAVQMEDPGLRAAELGQIATDDTRWSAEARYLQGEASIEAKAYDKAREAFQQVLQNHGDSEYAPMAVDGLAFLNENDGNLEEALAGYTEVFEKWDDTFTGRRQPLNIARVQEGLGNYEEAITRYQQQLEIFPDSAVARKAEQALARLQSSMPELFPEEAIEVEPISETDAPVESSVDVAPVTEAVPDTVPATDAPAEAAPIEDAPAEAAPAEAMPEEAEAEASTEAAPAEDAAPEGESAGSDS